MSKITKDFSIISINRNSGDTYKLQDNRFFNFDISKSNYKKEFYITYIQNKDVVTTTIEISKTTPPEEIDNMIIVKTYEDLGLDAALDYKIIYSQSPSESGDSIFFNVFVVNSDIMGNDLAPIVAKTEYIDYVTVTPFLMRSLYQKSILVPDGNDCFVYLQKNDAFLVVYQNGEYFQSRTLRYSLKYIYDKFVELSGNRIDENSFYSLLKSNGINFENSVDRDYIIQVFDDMFFYIGDIINSLNKIYKTDIKNVYFGSDIGYIAGIEIFVEDRLNLEYKTYNLNLAINYKDFPNITQLDMLLMLTAQVYLADKDDEFNYSIFLRPPPLMKRDSGKLLAGILLGTILGLVYPLGQYAYGYFMSIQSNIKQNELNAKNAEKTRIESTLKQLDSEITQTKELVKKETEIFDKKQKLLLSMHDKKNNYAMKSFTIFDISQILTSEDGLMTKIFNRGNKVTFTSRTRTDKKMTEIFKKISQTGKYSVTTKSIVDDSLMPEKYESNITVEAVK